MLGAGVSGFIAGIFIWGFIALLILVSPARYNSILQKINGEEQLVKVVNYSVGKACDGIGFLSRQTSQCPTKEVIGWLIYGDQDEDEQETD